MRAKRAWCLVALLVGACAIPNIEIVDKKQPASKGGTSQGGGTATLPESDGGVPGGGDPGAAGEAPGGTSPSGGSSPVVKDAFAKFCNAVVVAGETASLDLRIGEGPNLVHIVADSGTCSPLVNRPCTPIPSGKKVKIGVFDLNGASLFSADLDIASGDGWVFSYLFDESLKAGRLGGNPGLSAQDCSSLDFQNLFP
jgi:hypothetical protein